MSDDRTLTTRQGHPVRDNQSTRTVGERGPATLENYQFIEKITHFDRERIPERVVHARGTGARGYFEAYGRIGDEPASKYTRAVVLNEAGVRTPMFVRFSTVIGGKDSPETARDPRGFAVKFYTKDGNWDLVGNNLRIFFIRDSTSSTPSSTGSAPPLSPEPAPRATQETSSRAHAWTIACTSAVLLGSTAAAGVAWYWSRPSDS